MRQRKILGKTLTSSQTTRVKVKMEVTVDVPFGVIGESTEDQLATLAGCEITEELAYQIGQDKRLVDIQVDGEIIGDVEELDA